MITVLCVFGTRPEAIKMAPVIRELQRHADRVRCIVCVTGQHRQMLDHVLALFHIIPDYDLQIMQENQTLSQVTTRILLALEPVLSSIQPDWLLVQGDTTTTLAASLLAFYHKIAIGHVEAGLRTRNKYSPFPEEINRCLTGVLADLHFAPTEAARQTLLAEGVAHSAVHVTGNTVVDALSWVRERVREQPPELPPELLEALTDKRLILVTGHRRENFGTSMEQLCLGLRELAESHPEIAIVYPVHLNPHVQEPVHRLLGQSKGIHLIPPLSYAAFVWLLDQAFLVITDSGGVQEEAPSFGKPVLVTRETTERPEGIQAGNALLIGCKRARIVQSAHDLLTRAELYASMARATNPYGDGQAAQRIVQLLLDQDLSMSKQLVLARERNV